MFRYVSKKNSYLLVLFIICLIGFIIVPTYAMFQSNEITDDDIVGINLSFNLDISNIEEYEEINVASGGVEVFNVEVSNSSSNTAYYGVWYKMIEPSTINADIKVAKFKGTRDVSTSGSLSKNGNTTVTIVVVNDGETGIKLQIGVASSTTSTGDIEYLNGKKLITDTVVGLSSVSVGSYVAYTGNNGCPEGHCDGTNANYVSDTDMGYCQSSSYKFTVNGWRVGYKKNNSAYLVSAGAPECVRTYVDYRSPSTGTQTLSTSYYYGSGYTFDDTTGKFTLTGVTSSALAWSSNYTSIITNTRYTCKSTSSTGTCSTLYEVVKYSSSTQGVVYSHYNYDGPGVENHIKHLDKVALTYCNKEYAYGGVCNSNSAWAMNGVDFNTILMYGILSSCAGVQSADCGYGNDLIDNGGYYWYATAKSSDSAFGFYWVPYNHYVDNMYSNYGYGIRPVLRLASSVIVIGGTGTYTDPYIIRTATKEKAYLSGVSTGSYVAYTGNNGCSGNACKGQNANYVSSTDKGYCYNSNHKFTVNGWRVGYVNNGSAYLVSAGAPECVVGSVIYTESVTSTASEPVNVTNSYYYGSGYVFDSNTGYFHLTGVSSTALSSVSDSNFMSTFSSRPYTCLSATQPVNGTTTGACTTMYKLNEVYSASTIYAYTYTRIVNDTFATEYISNLDNKASTYCNANYVYGSVCNSNSVWAMDADDFLHITGREISSCNNGSGSQATGACGYNNDLIDNGGFYWYGTAYNSLNLYSWDANYRNIVWISPTVAYGLRPVIRLSPDVYITSGSGTEEDPYIISK